MKAAIALLTDRAIENAVQRLAWRIHLRWRTGIAPRCLPAHVSLKQPFAFGDDLDGLETYLVDFAQQVAPQPIALGDFTVRESVLGIAVHETDTLRALHDRLNAELPARFGDTSALFDGPDYRFHLTVASGGVSAETYRTLHAELAESPPTTSFVARELALFVYEERDGGGWDYLVHTILPLTGAAD